MLFDNVVLLLIAAVLFILALIIGYFIAGEVGRVIREFASQMNQARAGALDGKTESAAPRPRRNRATVERLITHFEEEQGNTPREE